MSDDNPLAGGDIGSVHGEDIAIKNLDVISSGLTTIHSGLTSTAERREGGEEITAAALGGASTQSAVALAGAPGQPAPKMYDFKNIPFAGGDGTHSILSVLFGAHSIGEGIFGFLTMIDSKQDTCSMP